MTMKHEQMIYRQITEILVNFIQEETILRPAMKLKTAADAIMEIIDEEREGAADDKLWDYQCQQQKDLLWGALAIGVPDLFSEELRSFWNNGRPDNI